MRQVMLDALHSALECPARKCRRELCLDRLTLCCVAGAVEDQTDVRPLPQGVTDLLEKARAWVRVDSDQIDVCKRDASFSETVADCFRRETRPVLDAPKSF